MFTTISKSFGVLAPLRPLAGWFIRLSFASVFLYHGTDKFISGIEGFGGALEPIFGGASLLIAFLVAVAEILAGIGAIVGGFRNDDFGDAVTRLAGLAAFPVMVGAFVIVRFGGPWVDMEKDVLLTGTAVYLMLKGKDV